MLKMGRRGMGVGGWGGGCSYLPVTVLPMFLRWGEEEEGDGTVATYM